MCLSKMNEEKIAVRWLLTISNFFEYLLGDGRNYLKDNLMCKYMCSLSRGFGEIQISWRVWLLFQTAIGNRLSNLLNRFFKHILEVSENKLGHYFSILCSYFSTIFPRCILSVFLIYLLWKQHCQLSMLKFQTNPDKSLRCELVLQLSGWFFFSILLVYMCGVFILLDGGLLIVTVFQLQTSNV